MLQITDISGSISSKVQFTDEEILKYVSEKFGAYKDKCISNGVHNYIYNGRGSVTNYKVGFRQNGVTHYRRIQILQTVMPINLQVC